MPEKFKTEIFVYNEMSKAYRVIETLKTPVYDDFDQNKDMIQDIIHFHFDGNDKYRAQEAKEYGAVRCGKNGYVREYSRSHPSNIFIEHDYDDNGSLIEKRFFDLVSDKKGSRFSMVKLIHNAHVSAFMKISSFKASSSEDLYFKVEIDNIPALPESLIDVLPGDLMLFSVNQNDVCLEVAQVNQAIVHKDQIIAFNIASHMLNLEPKFITQTAPGHADLVNTILETNNQYKKFAQRANSRPLY